MMQERAAKGEVLSTLYTAERIPAFPDPGTLRVLHLPPHHHLIGQTSQLTIYYFIQ